MSALATEPVDVVPRSIGRVLDLLEIVLAKPSCTLTAAATASNLTPTTALRHLRALEARGYVDRDTSGLFSAGPSVLRMAASLHESGPLERLVTTTQPHLDALAIETGESSYLAVSDGRIATYIASAESPRAIRHVGWVGQNVTLDGTAIGAALQSPGTVVSRTGAVEPDITAISLALPNSGPSGSAKIGIAISVIGPKHRLTASARKPVTAALGSVIANLCEELGYETKMEAS